MVKSAIILFLAAFFVSGCAGMKEAAKGFAGISTKTLEEARPGATKKAYNMNFYTAHKKVKYILKAKGAYIYSDDPRVDLIAVYVSDTDTTPVGVFFTETGKDITLVEVSSPSTYAKETISKIVFNYLDGKTSPVKGKEKINVKK